MKRFEKLGGLLLVLAGLVLLLSRLPLATALEFIVDERYEVMKAFLCNKGFVLYRDIWNDQPPVHTMLLAECFRLWGPSILTARVLASAFGLLLFTAVYELIRRRTSTWCAVISCFLLLASPFVLSLNASVMLEVPAIGTALLSALLLFKWSEKRTWGWLIASGLVMGVALQIKLTAAVVAPAIAAEIAFRQQGNTKQDWQPVVVRNMFFWGIPLLIVFLAIGFTWGKGSLALSLKSHLTDEPSSLPFPVVPRDYPIQWNLFLRHIECVLAAAVGLAWAIRQRRWSEVSFPTVLLATLLFIHGLHRPWWNYYYLHFAVPLAWLSGWAIYKALKDAIGFIQKHGFALSSLATWKALALCILTAAVLARSEGRLEFSVKQLQDSPKINASPLLAKMRRYAPATHWVCAQDVMYPFHAQLKVPPELAVIMAKRFWSGQISALQIINVCRRYKPEQVLLPNGQIAKEWDDFLTPGYQLVYADREFVLYVGKEVLK